MGVRAAGPFPGWGEGSRTPQDDGGGEDRSAGGEGRSTFHEGWGGPFSTGWGQGGPFRTG